MCRSHAFLLTTLTVALATGMWSCAGSDTPSAPTSSVASSNGGSRASDSGGGAGGSNVGTSGPTGTLVIRLTDSPFSDAMALLVTFSGVSVHTADPGEWKTLPFASGVSRTCDLKQLTGATDVLGVGPLAAGKYTQIRLTVTDAALYFDNAAASGPCAPAIAPPAGANAPVDIPSGEVKLNHEFTLTSTGTTILLDFDGDKSIHQTGSANADAHGKGGSKGKGATKYIMHPVIRVVSVQ